MVMVGILVLLGVCCISGVQSGATSLLCPTCDHPVKNPDECTNVHKCGHEQHCSVDIVDVVESDGTHRNYLYGCKDILECHQAVAPAVVGKRGGQPGDDNHIHGAHIDKHLEHLLKNGYLVCSDCCTENNGHCNKDLCAPFVIKNTPVTAQPLSTSTGSVPTTTVTVAPAVTSAAATTDVITTPVVFTTPAVLVVQSTTVASTTTIAPTQMTSTTPGGDPNCRDHEEDGLSCATFDLFRFCTDTSVFAYVIAHEKCPKHCGFCTPTTQSTSAPIVPPPKGACEDYEQDGFQCSKFDLFSFCTDSSSLAYVISHEKCRKHCGFCTSATQGVQALPSATLSPNTSTAKTTVPTTATPTSTTSTAKPTTTTTASTTTTTAKPTTSTSTTTPTPTTTSTAKPTTTAPASITTSTTSATTRGDPNCRDHEEDGLSCATFDLFRFCTDTSVFAYVIAHEKCPKHCGFCTPTTQSTSAPIVPPPKGACEDYEQDGFQCSKFDLFSFCTDSSSLAYIISHEKCRKHCGFCTSATQGVQALPSATLSPTTSTAKTTVPTTATPTSTTSTAKPTTTPASTTTTTAKPTTSTSTTTPTPTTTSTAKPTTTAPASITTSTTATTTPAAAAPLQQTSCVDLEDPTFNCADWSLHGYCLPFPGPGYETAKQRCRKTCQFC